MTELTPICKKCGSTDAELTYLGKKADLRETASSGLIIIDAGGTIDALFTKCGRCGYSWTQAPLDKDLPKTGSKHV